MVVGVEQSAVGGDEGQFGGGGACIHPQPSGAGVSVDVRLWGPAGIVPDQKGVVLLLRVKERGMVSAEVLVSRLSSSRFRASSKGTGS